MSKLVSRGRFKVLIDENGDIVSLELGGEVYEGHGRVVPIPFVKLVDVRLEEIPEGVYIEPVESIKDNVIYPLKYSETLAFDVYYGPGEAFVELTERRKFWEGYVGLDAYAEALDAVLRELERLGLVRRVYTEWSGDYFVCEFTVPLPPYITLEAAVAAMRKFLELLVTAVRRSLAELLAPLLDELMAYPPLEELTEDMSKVLMGPLGEDC